MKHLRKFNENIDNEIQEFCENYLAYLLDKDFNIEYVGKKAKTMPSVNSNIGSDDEILSLKKGNRTEDTITNCKLWNLNKNFNMDKDDRFFIDYNYNLSQILEDKVSLEELTQINIYFK